jgi:TolA-binding protein
MTSVACRRAQRALLRDDARIDDVATRHHLQVCPDCHAAARARASVRETVRAADDAIDDLTKARVLGRVLKELARDPVRRSAASWLGRDGGSSFWRGTRGRTRLVWSLGLAAACGVLLGLSLRPRQARDAAPPVASARFTLEPYALHVGGEAATPLPEHGLDRLQLPARAWMRARLGPSADLTLLGPLELSVHDSRERGVDLALRRGALVGDFDGTGGGRLRIRTGDASIEIVGTRFLVEATSTSTRVSVAHGRVRVESRGRLRMIDGGMSWSTEKEDAEPLPAGVTELFARAKAGSWGEARGDHGDRAAPTDEAVPAGQAAEHVANRAPTNEGRVRGDDVADTKRAAASNAPKPSKLLRAKERLAWVTPPRRNAREQRLDRSADDAFASSAADAPPIAAASPAGLPSVSREPGPSDRAAPEPLPKPAVGKDASEASSVAPSPAGHASTPPSSSASAALQPPTPSELYRRAEAALGRGDEGQGRALLEALVNDFPHEQIVDSARFELALLAKKAGRSREALAETREILGHGGRGPFIEPARFLRCRVYLEEDRDAAMSCLTRFVHDYPRSPHDAFALRALTELAERSGNCAKAAAHAELYLQRHPDGDFAAEARRVRSHCGD